MVTDTFKHLMHEKGCDGSNTWLDIAGLLAGHALCARNVKTGQAPASSREAAKARKNSQLGRAADAMLLTLSISCGRRINAQANVPVEEPSVPGKLNILAFWGGESRKRPQSAIKAARLLSRSPRR